MEDEILDYNWVISKEIPLKKEEATLFQEYFNEDSLILAAAMLHDNNIEYHIEVDNPESKNFGNLLHEIHINEHELERASELLELLINEDEKYPVKKYYNYSLSSLEFLLEENENVYVDTLVRMELKRRGVEIDAPEEEAKDLVFILAILSVVFVLFTVFYILFLIGKEFIQEG